MMEVLQEAIESQRELISSQQECIEQAIVLLEALVLEEDANPEKIEEIIKVLTYVG